LTAPPSRAERRLAELAEEHALSPIVALRLLTLLDLVATEPASITSIRDPDTGVDVHVADSLAALGVDVLAGAGTIADLGSGGGFPGLVLAAALPAARVRLVESVARKARFLRRAVADMWLENAEVVDLRVEEWAEGAGGHDAVTARALGSLAVLVEYAAPLLRPGGTLVAWKGRRDPAEEAAGARAAEIVGMSAPRAVPVVPWPGSGARHLYLSSKVSSTPNEYPRRPGMARKRPLGG
jgi:16S rRNA (guanine527-N7)-methyltransferase